MKQKILFLICTFCSICFLGCKKDIDTMMEDYASIFPVKEKPAEDPGPGEPDFYEKDMLRDDYLYPSDGMIQLSGPKANCGYLWEFEYYDDDGNSIPVEPVYSGNTNRSSQTINIHIPESGLEPGITYYVTLTVTSYIGGAKARDKAVIVIYERVVDLR